MQRMVDLQVAAAYLSRYFANQGWIPQEKVKQAKTNE